MSNRSLVPLASVVPFVLAMLAACSVADDPAPVDAAAVPTDPTGWFAVRSAFSITEPPVAMTAALDAMSLATDGPDDPSRYLVDLLVERLPDGWTKTYARELAPFVAAYVDMKIDLIAPRFVPGVHQLADGTNAIARRFGTLESLQIASDGRATRVITGLVFDTTEVAFAPLGIGDLTASTTVSLDDDGGTDASSTAGESAATRGDALVIAKHLVGIDYGQVLRLGLDRAVIPSVTPGCTDLACALAQLVDCTKLGAVVAEKVGFGAPALYASACAVGLTAAAAKVYAGLPPTCVAVADATGEARSEPIRLEVSGAARGFDRDHDGYLDAIEGGVWTGTFDRKAIGAATFGGTAAP